VEQVQKELANACGQKGIASDLAALEGIPVRSLAMLICKIKMKSEVAANNYPRRPPMTTDVQKVACASSGGWVMPVFFIHFS
jgi:hypothetical protein